MSGKHCVKHIFVTGGVVSSLGKGLTSASIGMLLESRGLKVVMQKFDPYINVDPGTMNPFQHGEVYVTDDGTEADLDLGHYERFTHSVIDKNTNYTTGKIYNSVISKEREGEYLGQTVQVVPHITNEIKEAVKSVVTPDTDIVITEIGGTVGDIESLPFLEAIRQFGLDVGRDNVVYIHLTLLPYLKTSGEIKTKPTQHSVGKLREIGIQPDILICRTEKSIPEEAKKKIALFCNVKLSSVIEEQDVEYSIYEVPKILIHQGLDNIILEQFKLKTRRRNITKWNKMLNILLNPDGKVEVAVIGKYIELHDSYKSIFEALTHGGIANHCKVKLREVNSDDLITSKDISRHLKGVDGILVPGGFGKRGVEGKIKSVTYARKKGIPFFGICLGMQCAVIEIARNVCGLKNADSSEFDTKTPYPVISLLEEQKEIKDLGGTMRLGAYKCSLTPKSKAYNAYKKREVLERHRHRYEFNNAYLDQFKKNGVIVSGLYKKHNLVEVIELKNHPWFIAVQYHPEFKSKPTLAHPLFKGFISACKKYSKKK